MKSPFAKSLVLAALISSSCAAIAADYCPVAYLYATNIRTACEQFGSRGMAGLFESSLFINGMLNVHAKPMRTVPSGH
jgi:hypothetical protein